MSMQIGSDPGTSRLNFNLGGGRMEYIFGGALGLIILLAVVFTIWGGSEDTKPVPSSAAPVARCWCVNEGKEVEVKGMSFMQVRMLMMSGNVRMSPPCPSCQRRGVMLPEFVCPKCKNSFATAELKKGMPTPPAKMICPTCKINIGEYKPS